jgi:hypothetical protein
VSERSDKSLYGSHAGSLNPSAYLEVVHLENHIMQRTILAIFYISIWVEITALHPPVLWALQTGLNPGAMVFVFKNAILGVMDCVYVCQKAIYD